MTKAQKIIPNLWFDAEAKEAAEFYISAFPNSKLLSRTTLHDTPSGTVECIRFELSGQAFGAISAGPLFKLNPAISFIVNFDPSKDKNARENLDGLWEKLSLGGIALMPLDKYPFSERYGWIQDRFGLSWQLILANPSGEDRPLITPSLLFVGSVCGKAEEAIHFYMSVFKNTKHGIIARYPKDKGPDREGTLMFSDFMIEGQWLAAMDSAYRHDFGFNESISLMVSCQDQSELDYYWTKLSAVQDAEQCGWLKDKYGVSWQIYPSILDEMMTDKDPNRIARVTQAILKMKKLDIETLNRAYEARLPTGF